MREATLIFILIIMGGSIFGSNKNLQNSAESISNYFDTYSKNRANLEQEMFLVDTICTSTSRDTFRIKSTEKAIDYTWSLPTGALIFKKLSDTSVIVDWSNATLGFNNVCVAAQNTCGTSSNSCLEVFIDACNTKPIAVDDFEITTFNTAKTIHVQTNDWDANGDELITFLDPTVIPRHGRLSILKLAIVYTPVQDYIGTDSFQYIICDINHPSLCDTAKVIINIDHQAPIATNDVATINANTSILIPVQENDQDPEGGILITLLDSLNLPLNGELRVENQNIIYIPNTNFTGIDRFNYIICDNGSPIKCSEAVVTIFVTNSPPIAINDAINTTSNNAVIVDVLLNDLDREGGILSTVLDNTQLPTNGLITLDGNTILYTPNRNFSGTDQFNYIVCDNGIPALCDTGMVSVIVDNNYPIANNDIAIVTSNTPISIDVLNNDRDDGLLTVGIDSTSLTQNGIVTIEGNIIIYTPTRSSTGLDSISYVACDNGVPILCDTAWIYINIENMYPLALNDTITVSANNSITIAVQSNDPEDGVLTTSLDLTNLPTNGLVSIEGDEIIYTPSANYSGTDQFKYIVCDNSNPILCDTAIVVVTINNDYPIATNDTVSTNSNTPISIDVLMNVMDSNNGAISLSIDSTLLSENVLVTINGTNIIFTPVAGFTGTETIGYIVCDDGVPSLCDTAYVLIEVLLVEVLNTPPIAGDDLVKTELSAPIIISVLSNDFDPESGILQIDLPDNRSATNGTLAITSTNQNGIPQGNNYQIIYTPVDNYIGLDSFNYVLCDNGNPILCDTAQVIIEIFNNAPIAIDDNIVTQEGIPITSSVLFNDYDPNGHPIITKLLTTPNKGTITLDDNGQYTYTPFFYINGFDSFTYVLCEAIAPFLCDTASVNIQIFPINDPPVAINDINLTLENIATTGNILTNDFDPEQNLLIINPALIMLPVNGEVSLDFNGEYIYRPNFLFLGEDRFSYEICDDGIPSYCDTAYVVIEVISNEYYNSNPPIGVNDYFQTTINDQISGDLIGNDISSKGTIFRINTEPVTVPKNGTVEISTIGSFSFIPALNRIGTETFTYEICNFEEPNLCDTISVQIEILPDLGNSVHATDDAADGLEDQLIQGNLLANDIDSEGDDIFLQIAPITLPKKGNVVLQENGEFSYQAIKGYTGPDNFIYEVCDNGIPKACDRATVNLVVLPVPSIRCNQNITPPIIRGADFVCEHDSIYLFVQNNPSPLTVADQTTPLEYIWFNGIGDTIAITNNKKISLAISPLALSPFSMRAQSGDCLSPLSNLLQMDIIYLPEVFISIDNEKDTICSNTSFQLTSPFIRNARYEWSIKGNPIPFSKEQNVTIEGVTENVSYQLSVISEACESVSITTKTIYVHSNLNKNNSPSVTLSDNSKCGYNTLILNANIPVDSNFYQIEWTGPNNYTSFMAIDSIQEATTVANGQYTLVLTDDKACKITSNIQVTTVTSSTIKPIITSAEGPVCENGNIRLQAPSYEGKEDEFTWYKNGEVIENAITAQLFADNVQPTDNFSFTIPLDDCVLESTVFAPTTFEEPSITIDSAFQLYCSSGTDNISLTTRIEGGQMPYSIEWVGPNNFFSNNSIPTIINASEENAGIYTIVVTDQNDCAIDASTSVKILDGIPKPIISLSDNSCNEEPIQLIVTNYDGEDVAYEWTVPNEERITSLTTSSIIVPTNEQYKGAYILTTRSGTCTAQSDTFYLDIFADLTATPAAIYEKTENCAAANLELFANATGANLVYQWLGPNGFTSNLMNPIIPNASAENNGIYEVSISNARGCSIIAATNIIDNIQNDYTKPVLQTSGLTCAGEYITLTAPVYTGASVSYTWLENGTTLANENSPALVVGPLQANGDQYQLIVQVEECTLRSDSYTIDFLEDLDSLKATPVATYEKTENCAAANLELFANARAANLNYEWTGPNGFTSRLMNPVIINATTDNNGIYEVSITNAQGCSILAATNIIDNIQNGFPEPVLQTSGLTCIGGYVTLTAPIYAGTSVNYTWLENGEKIENENNSAIIVGPLQTNGDQYELLLEIDGCILRSDPYFTDILEEMDLQLNYKLSSNCGAENLQLLTNLSEGFDNLKFSWTGPNGFTSAALNATILNPNPENNGLYTLNITSGAGCESSADLLISNIIIPPEKPIIKVLSSHCEPGIQLIIENEVKNADYSWTNGDGTIIENSSQLDLNNNTTAGDGPYQVTIKVTDCEAISSLPYSTASSQIPAIQIGNSGPICVGMDATLFATKVDGYNYEWYNDQEQLIATESSTTINDINEATTYTLVVTKNGCSNGQSQQTNVLIETIPEIVNITKSETYCEGETIFLTAQNKNPIGELIRYTWTGPNGFSYIEDSKTDSFNLILSSINIGQAGSYSLQIEAPNGCSSATNSVLVNIIPGIVAPTLEIEENAVCAGTTLSLEARSTAVTAVRYEWYLQEDTEAPKLIETTDLPNYVIENSTSENSGNYFVKVVNEECASNFSNQIPILVFDVNTDLRITSSATEDKPGCYGDVLQLSLPFYNTASYRWFGPAGFNATTYNPIIESIGEIHEGEYFAIVKREGCQETRTQPVNVVINPKPATPVIVNSGPICKGDDLEFSVSSTIAKSSTIRFDWFNSNDILIANTDEPIRTYKNVPTAFSDQYYLEVVADGCTSDPSLLMDVQISDPNSILANAGEDQEFCATAKITLAANTPLAGEGIWATVDGGNFANSNQANTEVDQLHKGFNRFIWTVTDDICGVQKSDSVSIFVGNITSDQAIAGLDQDLCEEYATQLTATPLTETTGRWIQSEPQAQQGVQISSPTNEQTTINGLEAGNSYSFNWVISQTNCPDFEADEIVINVSDISEEYAIIQEESLYLCGENKTNLEAELPGLSTGQWSYLIESDISAVPAINPIKIAAATNPSTFAEGIPTGDNTFIWSLSNGACKDFSTDTIHILAEAIVTANPDDYVINVNDSISIDILENDDFNSEGPFNVIITKYPDFGELIENGDGTYMYQPINNYFGRDDFRYQLCNPNCEILCDTAVVNLVVNGTEGSGACFIPNVISPNKDGNNDIFTVACIDDFPDNQLSIFNRWGDKIYTATPYSNDWSGTYQGQDLPAGTYFYMLQLTDEGEPLQGFITIFR